MSQKSPDFPDDPRLGRAISDLAGIMERLRDPETGCPWDIEQDFASIAPYTIEEAYEVADAIDRGDMAALQDELGDLQLQVVYHARMAQESGDFGLADVIETIAKKMIRRHPHVFGDADESPGWDTIKERERADRGDSSAMDGVARALPALLRAEKLQKRAARAGFDWPDATGPRAKIAEELDELDEAADSAAREDELGDLLFAVVNLARHLKIDPEIALKKANSKFETRYRKMEEMAENGLSGQDIDTLEALWTEAKRSLDQDADKRL